jgi:hypothetical protein
MHYMADMIARCDYRQDPDYRNDCGFASPARCLPYALPAISCFCDLKHTHTITMRYWLLTGPFFVLFIFIVLVALGLLAAIIGTISSFHGYVELPRSN